MMEHANNKLQPSERDSLQCESKCDLRKSLAWDSAFFTSPGVLDTEELLETLNFQVLDNGADATGHMEPKSLLFESIVPARTSRVASWRKSLAWDNAFFTSPGVLDAEELSIINRGFERPESLLFPGFDEEILRSAESNSTITSDGYSLGSLEIDLFHDVIASSHKPLDASSNVAISTCKLKREKGRQNGHASKILDASSRARHAILSGEASPLSSVQPPKISGHSNPSLIIPSKRASLAENHIKMDNKGTKSATGKHMAVSKKMCLRESNNIISGSKPHGKSHSSVLPAPTNEFSGICYASADFTGKSRSNPLQRTTCSRLAASGSSFRTPLKYSIGNKSEIVNSSDSICLSTTPKSSSYPSTSSIEGWSSESSSSIKQRVNSSVASLVNTPIREISFDGDTSKTPDSERHHSLHLVGHEIQETKFMNQQVIDISMSPFPVSANVSSRLRPSGLRMPSPKMGFFDVENSAGLAKSGGLKFYSDAKDCSKIGNGISNANESARNGKHRLAGTSKGLVSQTGVKDEAKICLREKKQHLKEHGDVRLHGPKNNVHSFGEGNKENVASFENKVDDLRQRLRAIGFSKDFITQR